MNQHVYWLVGIIVALASHAATAAPKVIDPVPAGTSIVKVADQVAQHYPDLTQAQITDLLRGANPGQFDASGRAQGGSALLLPRADVARQLLGIAPPPAPTPTPAAQDVAPAPQPADRGSDTAAVVIQADETEARAAMADALRAASEGRQQAAYDGLLAQVGNLGGDPDFDYAFGLAALETGNYSQAALALQRVVFVRPQFAGARLDLARAHLALGDIAAARKELDAVDAAEPSPRVAAVVAVLREQIDNALVADSGLGLSLRVSLLAGYDSNANAATDDNVVLIGQQPIALSPNSRAIETPVAGADANLRYVRRLGGSETVTLFSNLGASHRTYSDAEFVDSTSLFGQIGQLYNWGSWIGSVGVSGNYTVLNDRFNNRGVRTDLGIGRLVGAARIDLGLRVGLQRYNDDLAIQDVNQLLGTLGTSWSPAGNWLLGLTVLGGTDSERQAGSPYGRDIVGARGNAVWNMTRDLRGTLGVSYLASDYSGRFSFATRDREDDQTSVSLGLRLRNRLPWGLDLSGNLRHIDNQSTLTLFDYDRASVNLILGREF